MEVYRAPELPLGQKPAQDTWAQKFEIFNQKHPEVLIAIRHEAKYRLPAGRIAMREIIESLRRNLKWEINNNFAPYYVDVLIEEDPWFETRFQRKRRAARKMKMVPA